MVNNINDKGHMNASSVIIDDIAPELMVRVYPYRLPNTNSSEEFIGPNATSIVSYDQIGFKEDGMKRDDDGNIYFEVLPSFTTLTTLNSGAGTSQIHKELLEIDSFKFLSNFFPKGKKEALINLNNAAVVSAYPLMFSMGRPFNEEDFNSNKLPVYMASNYVSAQDSDMALNIEEDTYGLYEVTLINLTSILESVQNSSVIFSDGNTSQFKSVSIKIESKSLFGGLDGKVQALNGKGYDDISFKETKAMPIINAAPVAINNRVEMMFNWFDTKMVLPLHIMYKFKSAAPLADLFKENGSWLTDGETMHQLLLDMITLSKLYVDDFSDINDLDKLTDATNSNYGAIKVNVKLGNKTPPAGYGVPNKIMGMLVGKDPSQVVNSLYETYLNSHPYADKNTLAIFKAVVVALSRYILCDNLALGGGLNDFNSIYLPWRLKFSNPIAITREENSGTSYYSINTEPQVIFDSHWYTIAADKIVPVKFDNLYKTHLIKSERNISQPIIPNILRELSIPSNPANVNINSDNELKYSWFIPTEDTNILDKLFLKDLTSTSIGGTSDVIINDNTINMFTGTLAHFPEEHRVAKTAAKITGDVVFGDTLATSSAETDLYIRAMFLMVVSKHKGVVQFAIDLEDHIYKKILLIKGIERVDVEKYLDSTGVDLNKILSKYTAKFFAGTLDTTGQLNYLFELLKWLSNTIDETFVRTTNHSDDFQSNIVTSNDWHELFRWPAENWMRWLKGSWLWKYKKSAATEAQILAMLEKYALKIADIMAARDHNVKTMDVPKAELGRFFDLTNIDFTQMRLLISGTLDGTVDLAPNGGVSEGHYIVNLDGQWFRISGNSRVESEASWDDTQFQMHLEAVEKEAMWYPNHLHLVLKAGSTTSIDLSDDRQLIFTKDEWSNLISKFNINGYEEYQLQTESGESYSRLKELNIVNIWHDNFIIVLDGKEITIPSINEYDETVAIHRIIFT